MAVKNNFVILLMSRLNKFKRGNVQDELKILSDEQDKIYLKNLISIFAVS